ncbi:hypothetical protein PCANC_10448 [Puccinia coronata f. sp. avenae]|uniref:RNase III domain-containing protein n=1 Tax=Puccinia coronata f. sp. avenae TaxID=200324 RepID=A0A2N5SHM7_9BASI|nr:hypothetical protein PCASD_22986 [Puccinia coronata f. sp. avenae]PLW49708.1 hypothetical protein PCANC_10448 [Puccinia coronata f. sp. avenae]
MSRRIPLRPFSTQPNAAAPNRIASSFKPGPFRGALLSQHPPRQNEPTSIPHEYSVSQLLRPTSTSTPTSTPTSTSTLISSYPSPSFSSSRSSSSSSRLHFPHSTVIKQHLEELLYPLTFSEQMACRLVSAKNLLKSEASLEALQRTLQGGVGYARLGEHNTKLSFIGRRAMHFALASFLLHAPRSPAAPTPPHHHHHHHPSPAEHSYPTPKSTSDIIDSALLTKFVLGQYVGHQWELEKIMRWRELGPVSSPDPSSKSESESVSVSPKPLHGTGLWTARGHVVEAIVGAVMMEHGTRLSIAVFNSLVLPHLSFRLDPALLPAIKALQGHDQELAHPRAGRVDWPSLNILPFLDSHPHPLSSSSSSSSSPSSSAAVNASSPVSVAAVG